MESFLATEEPAWVWDGQGRRILWANAAAAKLWGDATPARLKRRRQGRASHAPARLTELARSGEALTDNPETLVIPAPKGLVEVSCVFQRLQLAGGRPGLVVRVLAERKEPETSAKVALHPAARAASSPEPRPGKTRKQASRSDLGALKSIAQDIDAATARQAPEESSESISEEPPAGSPPRKPGETSNASPKAPAKGGKSRPTKKSGARTRPSTPAKSAKSSKRKRPAALAAPPSPSREEMAGLLARVSHEIRNPLTIILGFAEILKSDRLHRLPEGKAQEYASDIYRTAQLALGLADDLLGFAERVEGSPPPPHDWIDLNALVVDCLHLLEPAASAQGVRLTRRLRRDAPWLLAHERSVRQILLNLLMNALRHGEGGGKISVSTRRDREGDLVLSVKDDGPGMTPAQIAAAKAPEQAGDVKQAGRRGLGLRLVIGFVRDNQGDLDIISRLGEGTDVRIRFGPDRLRAPEPKNASKAAKAPHAKTGAKATKTAQKKTPAKSKTPAKARKSPTTQKAAQSKTPAKRSKSR